MVLKNSEYHLSFKNAINGVIWVFTKHPNFKIHILLSIAAIILGFLLHVSNVEMTILVLAIVFGLGVEMVNTSIESMTDLITKEWRREAKIAKDVSAGMMLVVAVGTIIIALLIFTPRIINII